jgi:hypothetical protein
MIYDYMHRPKEQLFITESYVSSPPALWIHDERGHVFTLATDRPPHPDLEARGEFSFEVNWSPHATQVMGTGTFASRLERRNGKVRAFTRQGWKTWSNSGNQFL